MRSLYKSFLLLLAFLCAGDALATGKEFYGRGAEGWFWYIDPEPEPDPEPEQEPEIPIPVPAQPPGEDLAANPEEGPPAFSVQWYQENMETILNRAIDDPTEENVAAYFFVHRLMLDKANQFAVNAREVAMAHPQLDEMTRVSPGSSSRRITEREQRRILAELGDRINAKDGAVWFWYGDDIYSQQMARVVRTFRNKTGVNIVAFSVTGNPLPEEMAGWFPDYVIDDGNAAKRVGVTHTPAIAVALPPDRVRLIAHGVMGLNYIEDRLVIAADQLGLLKMNERNIYEGRMPGSDLISSERLPELKGNDTQHILEVMSEVFGY